MRVLEEIIEMAKNNNGTITTAMIVKAGFLVETSYSYEYFVNGGLLCLEFDKITENKYNSLN